MEEETVGNDLHPVESGQAKEYKRSKQDILKEYDINIRFLSVGCVIRVGCREVAFGTREAAINSLNDYFRDPQASIEFWNKKFNED